MSWESITPAVTLLIEMNHNEIVKYKQKGGREMWKIREVRKRIPIQRNRRGRKTD